MSDTLITVEEVTKRYGNIVAVNNVSLAISRGEVYSLVGANGAGKSTLIRMIVGIADPDRGRVLVCGEDLAQRGPTTKRHLGYLPEELILYERLTGKEYLHLVAGLREADAARIPAEVDFFELAHVENKLVGGYSLGMRQRLGVARALIGRPKLLLLDEPTNGLDPAARVEMLQLVQRIGQDFGIAVLVTSHLLGELERVSDHVIVLDGGRLLRSSATADFLGHTGGLLVEVLG
ncbi:MAG TPA: ABC transporter ATP-binding protein, partial [Blastocatellia bacterium]